MSVVVVVVVLRGWALIIIIIMIQALSTFPATRVVSTTLLHAVVNAPPIPEGTCPTASHTLFVPDDHYAMQQSLHTIQHIHACTPDASPGIKMTAKDARTKKKGGSVCVGGGAVGKAITVM